MGGLIQAAEDIARGQSVARYALHASNGGGWSELARGTTIGYAKIDRVVPTVLRKLRLVVEGGIDTPSPVTLTV